MLSISEQFASKLVTDRRKFQLGTTEVILFIMSTEAIEMRSVYKIEMGLFIITEVIEMGLFIMSTEVIEMGSVYHVHAH